MSDPVLEKDRPAAGESKPVVHVKNLIKNFKLGELEVKVLQDISLDIHRGEFVSIMGPSGSGKSTLLYLMGGLDKPTAGQILLGGKELSSLNDRQTSIMRRREMGFVFQFYNLIPNLNVEENVMLPLLLDGKKIRNHRGELDDILNTVELSDRRKHTPRELSGGQQQRVAIARALISSPEILFADEPIGNLDSKTGTEVMELLQRINQKQNKTIVMVTHSKEAAQYGTKTIYVRDGKIWDEY